jgi:hypothetical protein
LTALSRQVVGSGRRRLWWQAVESIFGGDD